MNLPALEARSETLGSRLPGYYRLSREQRIELAACVVDLSDDERAALRESAAPFELVDSLIENAVGAFPTPLGIATNFLIDGHERLVPMAVEESSVVAAASHGALLARSLGGFETEIESWQMIGQIELYDIEDIDAASESLRADRDHWIRMANARNPWMVEQGAGCKDVDVRVLRPYDGSTPFIVVHLLVDPLDAMGANLVTSMCEALAGPMAHQAGGRAGLRILSNLADRRVVRARCRIDPDHLVNEASGMSGREVRDGIVRATHFADVDPYRATTHNKGVMNGVDAVAVATGNDWRAVEAGAHAYAARSGRYRALTRWWVDDDHRLAGEIAIPVQVGIVGGVTRLHPVARAALKLLRVETGQDLGRAMAAVGLAQNLSALRALVAEGIQYGHMRLHARNLAMAAGAEPDEVVAVVDLMEAEGRFNQETADQALAEVRSIA
jgi:hydroxymethylglutaryl-CoA reductase